MIQNFDTQLELFIKRSGIKDPEGHLLPVLQDFFSADAKEKHIILKRSVLYFYRKHNIERILPCKTNPGDTNVYTFDSGKVAVVSPAYFVGSSNLETNTSAKFESALEIEFSNNNNNNNNNGNNNNG